MVPWPRYRSNLVAIGMNSPNTSADTSPPKVEILSIYMRGGESFHLIQTPMTLKNTFEMSKRLQNNLDMVTDAVLNLFKATMPTEVVRHLILT